MDWFLHDNGLRHEKSSSRSFRVYQTLARETFKAKHNTSRQNCSIFLFNEKLYNRRSKSSLKRRKVNTVYFGSENFPSLETKICELGPIKNKNKLLSSCKSQINTWTTDKCPYKIYKTYISQVGQEIGIRGVL